MSTEILEDVVLVRPFMTPEWGIYALCVMQVCAHSEVPPEQVERRANELNPSGTHSAWKIIWGTNEESVINNAAKKPAPCDKDSARIHYLLSC